MKTGRAAVPGGVCVMSDFFRRWSARKQEALRQSEALQGEKAEPVATPATGDEATTQPETGEASAKGAVEPATSKAPAPGKPALPDKAPLPDKETLRAMFRSHVPDGLDDYNQDFSQPELLPAALTAGLRNWLVDVVTQETAQQEQAPEQAADAAAPAATTASAAPDNEWDILVAGVGQNVAPDATGVEREGS